MAQFDTVIKGGIVVDGTGRGRRRADIGIKDGVIAEIGRIPDHESESLGNPVVADFFEKMDVTEGIMTAKPERLRDVWYGDCSDEDVAFCAARLRPHPMGSNPMIVPRAAWRHVPSTYVICEHDGSITLDYMRAAAKLTEHHVNWRTSHSPFLSRPELVVDLVDEIATKLMPR